MPKFAPVAPVHLLEAFQTYGVLGEYHLLLAHDVADHPDEYRKLFGERKWEGTVILDNSVVELKEPLSIDVISQVAEVCRPNVVVLPDIYENQQETIKSCTEAVDKWTYPLDKVLGFNKWTYMYVPQGLSLANFIYGAQQLLESPLIGWWGVPRNLVKHFKTRERAVSLLHTMAPHRKMHMLGFSDDMMDDIYVATEYNSIIEGIDSAVPIRLASIDEPFQMIGANGYPPRGEWWNSNPEMKDLMLKNLDKVRSMLSINDATHASPSLADRVMRVTEDINGGSTYIPSAEWRARR